MEQQLFEYLNSTLHQQQLFKLEKYSNERIEYIQTSLIPSIIKDCNPVGKIKEAVLLLEHYNDELQKMSDCKYNKTSDKAVGGDFISLPRRKRLEYNYNADKLIDGCDKLIISLYKNIGDQFAPIHYIVNALLLFFKSFNICKIDAFQGKWFIIPEFNDIVNNIIFKKLYLVMSEIHKLCKKYDNEYMNKPITKKRLKDEMTSAGLHGIDPTRDELMELKAMSENHKHFIDLIKLNYKCTARTAYRWLKKFDIPSDRRTKDGDTNVTVNADTNVTVNVTTNEEMVSRSDYDAVLKELQELKNKMQQSPVDVDMVSKADYDEVVNDRDYYKNQCEEKDKKIKALKAQHNKDVKEISDLNTTLSNTPNIMPTTDTNNMQLGIVKPTISTGVNNIQGLEGWMPTMSIG